MEYLIILFFTTFGVGFHIITKLREFDKLKDDDTPKDVWVLFIQRDWLSLIGSALVLALMPVLHYVIHEYGWDVAEIKYYHLIYFGFSAVMGFAGQSIVYKFLGKGESLINKKIDEYK